MADNPQDNANIDDVTNKSLKDRARCFATKQRRFFSDFSTKMASATKVIKDNAILKRIFGDGRILYPSIGLFAGIIKLVSLRFALDIAFQSRFFDFEIDASDIVGK